MPLELKVKGHKVPIQNLYHLLSHPYGVYNNTIKFSLETIKNRVATEIRGWNSDKLRIANQFEDLAKKGKEAPLSLGEIPRNPMFIEYPTDKDKYGEFGNVGEISAFGLSYDRQAIPINRKYYLEDAGVNDEGKGMGQIYFKNPEPHTWNFITLYLSGFRYMDLKSAAKISRPANPAIRGRYRKESVLKLIGNIQIMEGRDFILTAYLLSLHSMLVKFRKELEDQLIQGF